MVACARHRGVALLPKGSAGADEQAQKAARRFQSEMTREKNHTPP